MPVEVTLEDENRTSYRAIIRPGNAKDRASLLKSWGPVLERGPEQWLDRDWPWDELGNTEIAFNVNPELLVFRTKSKAAREATCSACW